MVFSAKPRGARAMVAIAGESWDRALKPHRERAPLRKGSGGTTVTLGVLNEPDSLALWKGRWQGRERVFLTRAGLTIDGETLRLTSAEITDLHVGVYPAPTGLAGGAKDGIFTRFAPETPRTVKYSASFVEVQKAGPPREVRLGGASDPVAEQPSDADFTQAAVWRISLPPGLDLSTDPILRVRYVGDVARVTLNGRLITDDFYNGNPWEIGLRRHAPEIINGDLRLAVLPLRKDAVIGDARKIYLAPASLPDFGSASSLAALRNIEIIPRYQVELPGR